MPVNAIDLKIQFSIAQEVRSFEMLTPDGIIKMAEEAPTDVTLYKWLIYELEKAGENFYDICKDKGDCLEKALKSETRAVIVTIIAVIFTIFAYFFLRT